MRCFILNLVFCSVLGSHGIVVELLCMGELGCWSTNNWIHIGVSLNTNVAFYVDLVGCTWL
jgi:hypothetical protein